MNRAFQALKQVAIALLLSCLTLIFGCAIVSEEPTAQAIISSTTNPDTSLGMAKFTETKDGLKIQAALIGAPQGEHGFHIHAKGSCADGGTSAGGHYNPAGVKHGYLIEDGFAKAHAGDLGNIVVDADGAGEMTATIPGLTLADDYSIVNKAVILHADPDDLTSQPTGNAGGRIGCGIIQSSDF
ncbi:MAG: superoxide dismutase family protein [Leptolyngbyaceae cyanobacterium MO_188.B28]|nr:superoxide dismutase family protein [Leptolyngbyaceae cyanobacterium MO_188.B28]